MPEIFRLSEGARDRLGERRRVYQGVLSTSDPKSQIAVTTISEKVVPEVSHEPDLAPTVNTVLVATTPRQTRNTIRLALELHEDPPERVAKALIKPIT